MTTPRLRSEILWLVGNRVSEFVVVFLSIKLLSVLLGVEQYGEYTLALGVTQLAANFLIMPMNQAYLRYYHTAYEQGAQAAAGRSLFRWYWAATLLPLVLVGLITAPLAGLFGIAALTPVVTAFWFGSNYWRNLAQEICDLRRERRTGAILSITYQVANVLALLVGLWLLPRLAWVAILISAALAVAWSIWGLRAEHQRIVAAPAAAPSELRSLVITFGIPAALLLVCQWVQSFADRYLIAFYVTKSAAGVYSAANQLFGAPTLLMMNIMLWLVTPIAFQRARDIKEPAQLWSADKIVMTGIAVYMAVGLCVLPICFFWGPWLLTLMTTGEFQLTRTEITLIGLTRLLQCSFILVQVIFAVHQQMVSSLTLRLTGALIAVPSVWIGVHTAGITGAAAGAALSSVAYLLLLLFGPGGAFRLIRGNRRRLLEPSTQPAPT